MIVENVTVPHMASIKEAAEATGMSYSCIRKLCLQNKIIHIRIGSRYLINMRKLADFLNGEPVPGKE